MRWLRLYVVASFLHVMAWGMYFALSRFYVVDDLGGGYAALTMLVAVEWGAPATSIVWGRLADSIGRRKLVAFGASGAIAFALMAFARSPATFIALAAYASLAWGAAYPSILAPILSGSQPGRSYGVFSVGSTLGWAVGSLLMGVVRRFLSTQAVFLTASALYGIAYAIFYAFFPREAGVGERCGCDERRAREFIRGNLQLFVAVVLATLGIELGFNVFSVKLRHEIEKLVGSAEVDIVYGLLYGFTPSVLSIPARVVAGKLADLRDPELMFLTTTLAYVAYFVTLYLSTGLVTAIVWQLPIYPFYDVALYTTTARRSTESERSTTLGAVLTAQSIGGSLVALASPLIEFYGVRSCIYMVCTSLALSSILVAMRRALLSRAVAGARSSSEALASNQRFATTTQPRAAT